MTRLIVTALVLFPAACLAQASLDQPEKLTVTPSEADGWIPLFNGKDLTGWKASEHPDTFSVEDGSIVTDGDRAHLFYTGDVNGGQFDDFELWVEVMTEPNSNGGVFFHTEYQEEGWPAKGYEVQVNQTYQDRRKTGSLYGVVDILDESPVEDNQWYVEHVKVEGDRVVIRVDGEVTVDYTEPENVEREGRMAERKLGKGTFALQGHDPGSTVRYRQVWVKPLD
ncbi:DUF1080 domain-containing protein [Botrimarina sp.]|uniref:3-keto-disaccharide hydrolase n=1 Tax=Botrimarina sp. TaxID=2795802 RepID=UPI0032ED4336